MSTVQKDLAGVEAAAEDIPLESLDVSQAHLYQNDSWRPYFARLRREAPVHYLADSANGAFWSVTSWPLIKEVDTSHNVLSSANGISIVEPPPDSEGAQREAQMNSFISMDPPDHGAQRNTVQPAVAPRNLAQLEPLIRERAADILDNLPVGETFDWVDRVSVELTARMLATLFDFPYEDRRKLIYWSDTITNVPQVTGDDSIDMEQR
ncbi:MAG: cytochrome P450, partial [Pseudomonadota bacterium]